MTRVINIVSGKGGVGKTTLASNLAYVLSELGQDVIAMDANLTTPNLGLHLGMHLAPKTLHDVLRGKTRIKNSIYPHPFGFKILPASVNINDLRGVDVGRLPEVTLNLIGKTDYVLMDSAPGLGREATSSMAAANEILIITNPHLPAVTDALKALKLAEEMGKPVVGVVVNRVRRKRYELSREDIEEILGMPILVEIPEDKNIPKSIIAKRPIVNFEPFSPASIEIRRLAHFLVGLPFKYKRPRSFRILDRLVKWMIG